MEAADIKKIRSERIFSNLGVELCEHTITINGRTFQPDRDSAFIEFNIAHAWPVRVAYGTAFHAGTMANSFKSMEAKQLNRKHILKVNGSKEDQNVGTIMEVDFPKPPVGGWKITNDTTPGIRAVAVIHKNLELGKKVLKENVDHKYAVSMEVNYQMTDSGFLVERDDKKINQEAKDLMDKFTPQDFKDAGLGYVPVFLNLENEELCPSALLSCYDFDNRRVVGEWCGQRVTVLRNGINGKVHFAGVGLVRYGAEKEAQVQQLLAHDPDKFIESDLVEAIIPLQKSLVTATDSFLAMIK